jgi:hypothetical protein
LATHSWHERGEGFFKAGISFGKNWPHTRLDVADLIRQRRHRSRGFGMFDIAIWVIVVPLGAIAFIVWHGLKITRAQHQSAMATLSTLGDTHRVGYETLAMSVRRLEQRVKELEGRR